MNPLTSYDLAALRTLSHRSSIYASFLNPLTLWTVEVDGAHTRGSRLIAFKTGAGSHWAAIEPMQTAWVFRMDTPPLNPRVTTDWATPLRIRSISSSDGGVTGFINVAPNNIEWANNQEIHILHDYRYDTLYPDIDPTTEEFYKDVDVPYPGTPEAMIKPVVIAEFSSRAQFIRDGQAVFWVSLENSYAVAEGATIASHSVSIYPTGATVTWDATLLMYRIEASDLAQDYYQVKCTVEDTNGTEQWAAFPIFTHNPNPAGATYPHTDFELSGPSRDWESGGSSASLTMRENAALADVTDGAFVILWKENRWNDRALSVPARITGDNYLFFGSNIGTRPTPNGFGIEFKAAVFYGKEIAADATAFNLVVEWGVGGPQDVVPVVVADGQISFITAHATVDPEMVVTVYYDPNHPLASATMKQARSQVAWDTLPTRLLAFPQTVMAGYVLRGFIEQRNDRGEGTRWMNLELATIEAIMANEFQFSVPVTATEAPAAWEEYPAYLTTGRAANYYIDWQTNIKWIANVYGLMDNVLPDSAVDFEPGTVYQMLDSATFEMGIRSHFVCDRDGSLHLTPDVQLLRDTERAALPLIMTIQDEDRGVEWGVAREPHPRTAIARASGIAWDGVTFVDVAVAQGETIRAGEGVAYCSLAPGDYPNIGGADFALLDNQIVEDQDHVNELAGRVLARDNNPYPELTVTFAGDYLDVLDVAEAEFYMTLISRFDWILDFDLGLVKLIPRRVEGTYEDGFFRTSASFEVEAKGPPGIEAGCPEVPEDFDGGETDWEIDPLPGTGDPPSQGTGLGTVYAMNSTAVARTSNLSAASPTWTNIHSGLTGTFVDMILDPWSPSRDGYCKRGFALTTTGVFKCEDMKAASPTWTQLVDSAYFAGIGGAFNGLQLIHASINIEGFLGFSFIGTDARFYYARTFDYGDTWTVPLIDDVNDAVNPPYTTLVPHAVGGHVVIYCNMAFRDVGSSNYTQRLYKSSDSGATWSIVATRGHGFWGVGTQSVPHCPYDGNEGGNIVWWADGIPGVNDIALYYSEASGASATSKLTSMPAIRRTGVETHTFDRSLVVVWAGSTPRMSSDTGTNWTLKTAPGGEISGSGGFPYNDELYYACTSAGVFVSLNSMTSWLDKTGTGGLTGATVIVPDWTE